MYIYKTMGSMTIPVEGYIITIEGMYTKDRIPCLDALVGTMLELKMGDHIIEPMPKEPETPISTKNFMEYVKAKGSLFGRAINVDYAEGYTVSRYIGVENLFDLK